MKDEHTENLIKEILEKHEICYAYNESFKFYYLKPMPREECVKYVERRNQCKGGNWEVRRKADYEHHYNLLYEKSSNMFTNTNAWAFDPLSKLEYQKCYLKS